MIDQTVQISKKTKIGKNVKIWALSQIRENVQIGDNCIIGRNVYIDHEVKIGNNVKIQNNALIYYGSTIEDGVFIGPGVCLTNDKYPRAITQQEKLKKASDWQAGKIRLKKGASIGAMATILPDVTIGSYAVVGAGAVVTKSIPDNSLAVGNPAKILTYVCKNAHPLVKIIKVTPKQTTYMCQKCKQIYKIKNKQSFSVNEK